MFKKLAVPFWQREWDEEFRKREHESLFLITKMALEKMRKISPEGGVICPEK